MCQNFFHRLPVSFMTADVSKATCDILLATAAEVEKVMTSENSICQQQSFQLTWQLSKYISD